VQSSNVKFDDLPARRGYLLMADQWKQIIEYTGSQSTASLKGSEPSCMNILSVAPDFRQFNGKNRSMGGLLKSALRSQGETGSRTLVMLGLALSLQGLGLMLQSPLSSISTSKTTLQELSGLKDLIAGASCPVEAPRSFS